MSSGAEINRTNETDKNNMKRKVPDDDKVFIE